MAEKSLGEATVSQCPAGHGVFLPRADLVLLVVSTRDSALIAITFGCLLLPFLFEPHNAERWDPTATSVALALAHGGWARRTRPQESAMRSEEDSAADPAEAERTRVAAARP